MFKKIIIFLLILSPLFFLFVGYPITSQKQKIYPGGIASQRCFEIGNTREFFSCFKKHTRISGTLLVTQLVKDTNDLQQSMGYLLLLTFICQMGTLFFILSRKKRTTRSTL